MCSRWGGVGHGDVNVVIMVVRAFRQLLVFSLRHNQHCSREPGPIKRKSPVSNGGVLTPLGSEVRVGRLAGGHRKATGSYWSANYSHFPMCPIKWQLHVQPTKISMTFLHSASIFKTSQLIPVMLHSLYIPMAARCICIVSGRKLRCAAALPRNCSHCPSDGLST